MSNVSNKTESLIWAVASGIIGASIIQWGGRVLWFIPPSSYAFFPTAGVICVSFCLARVIEHYASKKFGSFSGAILGVMVPGGVFIGLMFFSLLPLSICPLSPIISGLFFLIFHSKINQNNENVQLRLEIKNIKEKETLLELEIKKIKEKETQLELEQITSKEENEKLKLALGIAQNKNKKGMIQLKKTTELNKTQRSELIKIQNQLLENDKTSRSLKKLALEQNSIMKIYLCKIKVLRTMRDSLDVLNKGLQDYCIKKEEEIFNLNLQNELKINAKVNGNGHDHKHIELLINKLKKEIERLKTENTSLKSDEIKLLFNKMKKENIKIKNEIQLKENQLELSNKKLQQMKTNSNGGIGGDSYKIKVLKRGIDEVVEKISNINNPNSDSKYPKSGKSKHIITDLKLLLNEVSREEIHDNIISSPPLLKKSNVKKDSRFIFQK